MTIRNFQVKNGKNWETTLTQDGLTALDFLATELAAHFIGKASYIRSIKRRNNFDGTKTYTITYSDDIGGGRAVYLTDIY